MNTGERGSARLIAALVASTLAVVTVACSGDEPAENDPSTTSAPVDATPASSTTQAGITEAEAIEIARRQQEQDDPDFDFESTRPVAIASDDTYDVSFPPAEPEGPGGEPHVVVDRTTGEVIETYLTR